MNVYKVVYDTDVEPFIKVFVYASSPAKAIAAVQATNSRFRAIVGDPVLMFPDVLQGE